MSRVTPDDWLSRTMGIRVYRVDPDGDSEVAVAASGNGAPAFYYAKADTRNVAAARALGAAGFYVVDVNVTFEGAAAAVATACARGSRNGIRVDACAAETAPGVLDIAGSTFEYSRFHLDPAVPRALADRVKREWIQSYVDGTRGDRLFVALDGGTTAGFLAALASRDGEEPVAVIDLVGVARDKRRRGVANALIGAFASQYGGARLRVGTQAANLPSIALYERCGFSIVHTSYVFHRHDTGSP